MTFPKYFTLLFFSFLFVSASFSQTIGSINITDEDELPKHLVVGDIVIKNNKITKPWVIINELVYSLNDSLARFEFISQTKQSRENLVNRKLFSIIDFDIEVYDEYKVRIIITVKERWNIWPAPVIQIDAPNINEFIQRKDWSRLSYGASLNWSNFFGSGQKLKVRAVFGNTNQLNVSYEIPALTKKVYLGLIPTFEIKGLKSVNYETVDDSQVLFRDDKRSYQSMKMGMDFKFDHSYYMSHTLSAGYEFIRVSDTLLSNTPTYLSLDTANQISFFTLGYDFTYDKRDSRTYPLKGYYFMLGIDKYGLGITKGEKTDLFYLNAEISGFVPIGGRFYWGAKAKIRTTPGRYQPYHFREGLGYNKFDYVRGYELYSIQGYSYAYFKTNFKFQALNKVWEFKKKPKKNPKKPKKGSSAVFDEREKKNYLPLAIYINAFSDLGYVKDPWRTPNNRLANEFLLGFGGSVDIVTVYDVVIRLEYVANRYLEHGFRIGLKAAF